LLKFKKISKSFKTIDGQKSIFDGFDLTLSQGEFLSVIGTNGAGKSTLVKLLVGDEALDGGDLLLKDESIGALPSYKRKRRIAKVYQDPSKGTAGNMTILENMALADHKGKRYGLKFGVQKKRIPYYTSLLKEVDLGLENQMHTLVGSLSGGQRQALALIMATMNEPEILVLDEHTSALDPKTAKIVMDKTKQIVEKFQIPTIMITHNMETAIGYANRLIKLDQGHIVLDLDLENQDSLSAASLF
jgi:putative ABC transport system ATP-binding protein